MGDSDTVTVNVTVADTDAPMLPLALPVLVTVGDTVDDMVMVTLSLVELVPVTVPDSLNAVDGDTDELVVADALVVVVILAVADGEDVRDPVPLTLTDSVTLGVDVEDAVTLSLTLPDTVTD